MSFGSVPKSDLASDYDPELTERKEPQEAQRAVYTERDRPRSVEEVQPQKRHLINNLQLRMVIYSVVINAIILATLQMAQFGFGSYQVYMAELNTTREVTHNLQRFIENNNKADKTEVATVGSLLYNFLAQEVPDKESTMLGFIDGQLRINLGDRGIAAQKDKELLLAIQPYANATRQKFISVNTNIARYTIGVIPIKVEGRNSGTLMVITDHDQAMQAIWGFTKLFSGLSLLVLALITFVNWRVSASLLGPVKTLREMISTVKGDRVLNKRIPVLGNDELSKVAEQTNEMISRLEDSVETQRALLEGVGHELRTPITVLRGHLELMDPNDPESCAHTRKIGMDSLLQIHRLAEDLMAVAWIDRADFLHPKSTNIGEIVMDLYEDARQLGKYQWTLEQICLVDVTVDPQRLRQAVLQLCQNATKFSAPGSVIRIGVGMDRDPQVVDAQGRTHPSALITGPDEEMEHHLTVPGSQHHLCIWVADQGIGISQENQSQVFKKFIRVSHERPGSGLGLPIANAIAQAHGGFLSLRSVPNVGSVFKISIPVTEEAYQASLEDEA